MFIQKIAFIASTVYLVFFPELTTAQTINFLVAYHAAIQYDSSFRAAIASNLSQQERIELAAAQLRPNISLSASRNKNKLNSTSNAVVNIEDYNSGNISIVIRQPIYRNSLVLGLEQARMQVKDADAILKYETQQVAIRVISAYLDALLSLEQLRLIQAQVAYNRTQLSYAIQSLKAGTGTRTDIYDAQARLDMSIAQEFEAKQNASYTKRQLLSITSLDDLELWDVDPDRIDMHALIPMNLQHWQELAASENHEIHSLAFRVKAAEIEVRKAYAGHQPTLDAIAQVSISDSENIARINTKYNQKSIGLQLNIPIYAGGYINSQVRQATAELDKLNEQYEASRQELNLRVEKEYRSITESEYKIKALQQAVYSTGQLVHSTKMSQKAGVRTFVDVLNAEQQKYQSEKELSAARHYYIGSYVRMMALVGRLNEALVNQLDSWLKSPNLHVDSEK